MNCPLCNTKTQAFFTLKNTEYYKCATCFAVSMHPKNYVNSKEEKNRYKTHNNNVNDKNYQKFVQPIVGAIFKNFNTTSLGLDFGCGTGPVITKLLRDKNYTITTYDPFFDNNTKALKKSYNYIACCEVIEHFYNPLKEFQLLKLLLKPNGKLYCMTEFYNETISFEKWYYKNDETHVFFYHKNTCKWIQENIGFSKVSIKNRLVIFEN